MSSLPKSYYSPKQYLVRERRADHKSEYLSGEIFAMAGAIPRNVAITVNIASESRFQLRKRPCQALYSDLRVRVSATDLFAYPDVVAVCDELQFDDTDADALINPMVIVEVLSKSTELHDRDDKFSHYRKIASLMDYILVSQRKPSVEHFIK